MQKESSAAASAKVGGLLVGLRDALRARGSPLSDVAPQVLEDKGLAHLHVRLGGTGSLARIPKQSQLGLDPAANLAYQCSCFERAQASGHTPHLHGCLAPDEGLPRGALLVEEIVGRSAALPADLPALARALAALHGLPVPEAAARAPLLHPADPLASLWQEIARQGVHLAAVAWPQATRRSVEAAVQQLGDALARPDRPVVHLIAFDAHPGNFIVQPGGRAVLVDLEKCRYGYPGLDLAHATLYTSTTWDVAACAVLSLEEVQAFYAEWSRRMDPAAAAAARPWHAPLRQAMWLWSLTWCAQWLELSRRSPDLACRGQDWSARRSDDALVRHVRERVTHYLSPEVIQAILREIAAIQDVFA